MEQLSFDFAVNDERKAFELIYPELSDLIDDAPIDKEVLVFREINDCSSVYFLSSGMIFFQIRLRKKMRYLLLPENYEGDLPEGSVISKTKTDAGMIRVAINSPEDILEYAPVLRTILRNLIRSYHVFGCCSRYEACSDAQKCIHPDIKFALGCSYRQNLMDGKVFYGKNRNID